MSASAVRHPSRQRGTALVVGLIFLVLITLVGITAMSSTLLQERMTGGQRNESLAFNGSESALRGAERSVWKAFAESDGRDPAGTVAAEPLDSTAQAFRGSPTWSASGTAYATIDYDAIAAKAGGGKLNRDPHYLIEKLGPAGGCPLESHSCGGESFGSGGSGLAIYYRITARSTGGDARVLRTTESVYAVAR
jgi:type IV pilus assembly protein PilX